MSLFVKVCGITSPAAAEAAVDSGADALGFVFAPSARRVTSQEAVELSEPYRDRVLLVAVFLRPARSDIEPVLEEFGPDLVQADQAWLDGTGQVARLPVVRNGEQPMSEPGSRILFEGKSSGVGERADRSEARRLAETFDLILAGGLNPSNVAGAIDEVRPAGVDVSSGVELAPGKKSPELIEDFVAKARQAERETVTR